MDHSHKIILGKVNILEFPKQWVPPQCRLKLVDTSELTRVQYLHCESVGGRYLDAFRIREFSDFENMDSFHLLSGEISVNGEGGIEAIDIDKHVLCLHPSPFPLLHFSGGNLFSARFSARNCTRSPLIKNHLVFRSLPTDDFEEFVYLVFSTVFRTARTGDIFRLYHQFCEMVSSDTEYFFSSYIPSLTLSRRATNPAVIARITRYQQVLRFISRRMGVKATSIQWEEQFSEIVEYMQSWFLGVWEKNRCNKHLHLCLIATKGWWEERIISMRIPPHAVCRDVAA